MLEETEEIGIEEIKDHILVRAWLNQETGKEEPDHCLSNVATSDREQATEQLVHERFLTTKNGTLSLSENGKGKAQNLIRRHRLAERLFSVVFNLPEEVVHAQACRMEHEKVLTSEAVEGICSFLGHPPTCPHGRPIPPGECCRLFTNSVQPLVTPLSQGEVGQSYRIVFMAPKYPTLLERLSGLGVMPGAKLELAQRHPSFVLKAGETEVALDSAVAEGIYVVRSDNN